MIALLVAAALLAPAVDVPAAGAAQAKEKKICRLDADTGSLVPHRTCRTKADWAGLADAEARKTRMEMRSMASTPGQNPN